MKSTFRDATRGVAADQGSTRSRFEIFLDTVPFGPLAVVFMALAVIATLRSHFWLDETQTYWVTNGGFSQLLARCGVFPLSLPYAALFLAIRSLGVTSEWVFRIPSLIAVSLTSFLIFRMAARRWGTDAGWFASAIFASLPLVRFAAGDARPYALGLLFIAIATRLLPEILESPGVFHAIRYCLAAASAIYFHLFFATAVAAHIVYLAFRWKRGNRISPIYIGAIVAFIGLLMLPLVWIYSSTLGHPAAHSFAPQPWTGDLLAAFLPVPVLLCLMAGFVYVILSKLSVSVESSNITEGLLLPALMACIPPLLCFAASRVSGVSMFVGRYWLSWSVGVAPLFGVVLSSVRPSRVFRFMLLCLAAANLYTLVTSDFQHTSGNGDWGSALAWVDRNTAGDGAPVLIRSQYVESDVLPLSPLEDNVTFSQLSYYPSKSNLIGLGVSLQEKQIRQLDGLLKGPLTAAHRFLLVSVDSPRSLEPLISYLTGRLGAAAQVRPLANFDAVRIIEFALPPG